VFRLKAALSPVALAGALAVSVATPATAAPQPNSHRPVGYVCFWTGPNYTGTMTAYPNPSGLNDCDGIEGGARTVYNNDDQPWDFFQDGGCRAFAYHLEPGQANTYQQVNSWI
jgi:hypothetical protein